MKPASPFRPSARLGKRAAPARPQQVRPGPRKADERKP